MPKESTGYTDKNGKMILVDSLVSTPRGIYIIKKDPFLDYSMIDVELKTVEKLTHDICLYVTLLVDNARKIHHL